MAEYRLLKQEDFTQAIDLADKTFRKEGHVSMGPAFPEVFSAALNQSYGAFIDGRLVSFIGLVPFVLHIGRAEVQAYSIGAVCTDPGFRRQGLANTLLQKVFEHGNKSGASVLFVSGDLPIYIKQGCTFYGKMNHYKIEQGDLKADYPCTVRELQPYDWFQIRTLNHERPVRYEQSIYEMAVLNESAGFASIFKMKHKVLVAEENQKVTAYLVFGVPYNEQEGAESRVIEWGGEPEALCRLIGETFNYGLKSLLLNVPTFETALNVQLASLKKEEQPYPGTIKILNLDLLLDQLGPFLKDKIDISKQDGLQYKLAHNQNYLVVGHQEMEELILKGTNRSFSNLDPVFPIPFPHPQGLNYV
ncbi:GNAT family N-acetyltransferase [Bacillus sp. FJAT-27251]|uniref:GNAT family N-acetyltransferase n=1 Tax=Bacillus sp. FJAT-27251 TaxID=1684142 RepID=UPI0006A7C1B8|nr:GNAT family N-acetyltransferase [Bacillus sp. FJAT-27251]